MADSRATDEVRWDMGGERGTRSIMNVRILVYINRADVKPPTVIWNTEKAPERKMWEVIPMRKCQVGTWVRSPGECPDQRYQGRKHQHLDFCWRVGTDARSREREQCPQLCLQEPSLWMATQRMNLQRRLETADQRGRMEGKAGKAGKTQV